jgi:hypothetical protein
MAEPVCSEVVPDLVELAPDHTTACLIAQRDGLAVVTERIPALSGSAA